MSFDGFLRTAAALHVAAFKPVYRFWGYVMDELGEQL